MKTKTIEVSGEKLSELLENEIAPYCSRCPLVLNCIGEISQDKCIDNIINWLQGDAK